MFKVLFVGTPGSLLPHPPKDRMFGKQGSKKLRVYGAGRERLASSGKLCVLHLIFRGNIDYCWVKLCFKMVNSPFGC